MAIYAAILIVPWLLALALTPLARRWALARGWLDRPGGRKIHLEPIPMLGGVAVFGAVLLGILLLVPFSPAIRVGLSGSGSLLALAAGLIPLLILGVYDDRKDLPAGVKLVGQIAAD